MKKENIKNIQNWLDFNYPKEEGCKDETFKSNLSKLRKKIVALPFFNISPKYLNGDFTLESFSSLEEVHCDDNQLPYFLKWLKNKNTGVNCLPPDFKKIIIYEINSQNFGADELERKRKRVRNILGSFYGEKTDPQSSTTIVYFRVDVWERRIKNEESSLLDKIDGVVREFDYFIETERLIEALNKKITLNIEAEEKNLTEIKALELENRELKMTNSCLGSVAERTNKKREERHNKIVVEAREKDSVIGNLQMFIEERDENIKNLENTIKILEDALVNGKNSDFVKDIRIENKFLRKNLEETGAELEISKKKRKDLVKTHDSLASEYDKLKAKYIELKNSGQKTSLFFRKRSGSAPNMSQDVNAINRTPYVRKNSGDSVSTNNSFRVISPVPLGSNSSSRSNSRNDNYQDSNHSKDVIKFPKKTMALDSLQILNDLLEEQPTPRGINFTVATPRGTEFWPNSRVKRIEENEIDKEVYQGTIEQSPKNS